VITALALRAAADPSAHGDTVDLLIGAGGVMTVVHVWGAVERGLLCVARMSLHT